jgi:ATP-binding cassette subfamily B protein
MQANIVPHSSGATAPKSSVLAAIAILASRLGVDTSSEQLRARFSLSEGEPSRASIINIVGRLGLKARRRRRSFARLGRLSDALPAMLLTKDGGALLLESARFDPSKGTIAIVRDPLGQADERVAIDELSLSQLWKGEVILITRPLWSVNDRQAFSVAWLAGQVVREGKLYRLIMIAAMASTVFAVAPAFIFRIVLDKVVAHNSLSTLNVITVAMVILIIMETALGHLQRLMILVATTRFDGRINLYFFNKLLNLPLGYFESNPTGSTLAKLHNIPMIRDFLMRQIFGAVVEAVPLLAVIPIMFILDWRLAIMALSLCAMIFLVVMAYLKPLSRAHEAVVRAEQARGAHLVETLNGMRAVKSLVLEGRRRKEWDKRVADSIEARHHLGITANFPQTLTLPFSRLIYSGCFAVGAYLVLISDGSAASIGVASSPGLLVSFAMLSSRVAQPLVKVASVMNAPSEPIQVDGLRTPIKGEIRFNDLSFRYAPGAPYALESVSFNVPRGTVLGIMGRSGSGKTTVTRLMQRLHTDYAGSITIDGMDLREVDLAHLRSSIGVVPQENFLFAGSIRDNIAMARPASSFLDVVKAAQLAGAEEFVERLPRGYDTILEEGASNLSGGQRQRLAIARALLINPAVLILDEATSALDAESEAIVNRNLKLMARGRTVISISHRLSMLVGADAILVLERGKVYDIGTHDELVRRCDIYKQMWFQQNRHLNPGTSSEGSILPQGA